MNTSLKTFFAAHKTTIIIASAVLVIGSKAVSFAGHGGQQQMPPMGNRVPQAYGQQMPQQNMNSGGGYFDSWFGTSNQNENYNYNSAGNQGNGGYTDGGYAGGNYYNPNAGAAGDDYNANYWKQQDAQSRQAEKFDDYIRDQAEYSDGYGSTYKLNAGYDNNYVNTTTNEALQTNDPGFDPNAYSTSTYTAVTPSDYSSASSYSAVSTSTAGDE